MFIKLCGNFLLAHRVNVEIGADFVQFEIHPLPTVSLRAFVRGVSFAVRGLFGVFVERAGLHDSEGFVAAFRGDARIPDLRAVAAVHECGVTEQDIAWPRRAEVLNARVRHCNATRGLVRRQPNECSRNQVCNVPQARIRSNQSLLTCPLVLRYYRRALVRWLPCGCLQRASDSQISGVH